MSTFVRVQQTPAHTAVPVLAAVASLGAGEGACHGFVARCPLPRRLPSGAPGQRHAVPPRGMPRPLTALFTPGGIKYRYSCETEGTTP